MFCVADKCSADQEDIFWHRTLNQIQLSIIMLLAHTHTYNTCTIHWLMIYVTYFRIV